MVSISKIGYPRIQVRRKRRSQSMQVVLHKIKFESGRHLQHLIIHGEISLLPRRHIRFGIIRSKFAIDYACPPCVTLALVPFKNPTKSRTGRQDEICPPHITYSIGRPSKQAYFVGLPVGLDKNEQKNRYKK